MKPARLTRQKLVRSSLTAVSVLVLVAASVVAVPQTATAKHISACQDLTVVFARGSGQSLSDTEQRTFTAEITYRLNRPANGTMRPVRWQSYELGNHSHSVAARYPATGPGLLKLSDAAGAEGLDEPSDYRASVDQGVSELVEYLSSRARACPDELLLVAGYSQGAQVVGESLFGIGKSVRDKILHVALFGDPKLHLPEGTGSGLPDACSGTKSPWRRGGVSCLTDGGILGSRTPYLPPDIESRVGSWCNQNDYICNNNPLDRTAIQSGHNSYTEIEIPEAVREAIEALNARLPDYNFDATVRYYEFKEGIKGENVAILLDSSGSMGDEIEEAKRIAQDIAVDIIARGGKVALVEYRDRNDSFVAEVRVKLTDDHDELGNALRRVSAHGGDDSPEALLTAMMTAFDDLDWDKGALKSAIVITDAGYHDPDLAEGWTRKQVVRRSQEIDPVNIYPIIRSEINSLYDSLAHETAGVIISADDGVGHTLFNILDDIGSRPIIAFELDFYAGNVSDVFNLRVDVWSLHDDITRYDWDFDGDGARDATTTLPQAQWTYGRNFRGMAEVRAISESSFAGNATVPVFVSESPLDFRPGAPTELTAEVVQVGSFSRRVELNWSAPAEGGPYDGFKVTVGNSSPSIHVQASSRPTLLVKNVPLTSTTILVRAYNDAGLGDAAAIRVHDSDVADKTCPSTDVALPFADMPSDHYAASSVACIFELGVTAGTSVDTYSPDARVTRAQMASFIARLYAAINTAPAPIVETPFTDVAADTIMGAHISRIYGLGITTGTSPTEYSPSDMVTRAQMASFMARLFTSLYGAQPPEFKTPFRDIAPRTIAGRDISRIFGLNITRGTSSTTYSPDDFVTRAQMALFMTRLYFALL